MRQFLLLIVSSVLIGIGTLTSILAVGRAMPLPTRIEDFRLDKCALPCWLGIEIGKTSVADAKHILKLSFPNPKYTFDYQGVIRITDRLTKEAVTVLLNDPGDPATQRDSVRVMSLDLWLGDKHPLTASELFGLVGEPESIGIMRRSIRMQAYVLYCNLNLRASPLKTGFDVSSPDSDMGRVEVISPSEDVCNTEFGTAWEGYTSNYRKQLVAITNRYVFGN